MKIKLLIVTCFLCCFIQAQNTQSYFSVNIGFSLPLEEYASKDINDEDAGFARVGLDVNIEGAFFPIDYIGIGGKFGNNVHFFDKFAYRQEEVENGAEEVSFNRASPYRNMYGFGGLFLNLPVAENFHITAKAMAGIVLGFSSVKNIVVTYPNDRQVRTEEKQAANFGFSPLFGLDMRYLVSESFMLKLSAETMAYSINYGYDFTGKIFLGKTQKYRTLSLTIGFATLF